MWYARGVRGGDLKNARPGVIVPLCFTAKGGPDQGVSGTRYSTTVFHASDNIPTLCGHPAVKGLPQTLVPLHRNSEESPETPQMDNAIVYRNRIHSTD